MAKLDTLFAKYDAKFPGSIPYFLVLDKKGKVRYQVTEPNDLSKLEVVLNKLESQKD